MDHYKEIKKVKSYLENTLNCSVELFSDLKGESMGRIYYPGESCDNVYCSEAKILIDCPYVESALFTILHEAGHYVSYLRYFRKFNINQDNFPKEKRELFAYLYGWYVIRQNNIEISKEEWKDFHEVEINKFVSL